jgi:hemoglobin-like flavoprotein
MNVQLLRTSFEHAVNNDPQIVAHFYGRLFADHPELRAYFPRDMADQERALGEKLTEIMLHLEDPDYLSVDLGALGTRHAVQYRVTPEMYGYVKGALISTLAGTVPGWNDELDQEWDGALTAVAGMMLAGAENAA